MSLQMQTIKRRHVEIIINVIVICSYMIIYENLNYEMIPETS